MQHRYWLATMIQSAATRTEISEAEYVALQEAVDSLLACTEAEENFEGLIDGCVEFETFLQSEALQALFSRDGDHAQGQARRTITGRKLSYFLSSARLYLDSIQRHACTILADSSNATVTKVRRREFDSSLSYRIMECLRDHAQHRALPVHGWIVSRRRTDDLQFVDYSFGPTLDLTELIANGRLRGKTKKELRIMTGPSEVEIKPLARNYLESLWTIHQAFRVKTSSTVNRHIQLVEETKAKMTAAFPDAAWRIR